MKVPQRNHATVRPRRRRIPAAAVVVGTLAVTGLTMQAAASSGPGGGDDTTSTVDDDDDTSTSAGGSTSSVDESTSSSGPSSSTDQSTSSSGPSSSVPGGTLPGSTAAPPTGSTVTAQSFEALLEAQCAGQNGQPLLAEELEELRGDDGSRRIVAILAACDVVFETEVNVDSGRPSTNVEAMIADPANDVTPNQAQTDALNRELDLYWRIATAALEAAGAAEPNASSTLPADTASSAPSASGPSTSTDSSASSSSSTSLG